MKSPSELTQHLHATGTRLGWTWNGPIKSGGKGIRVGIRGIPYRLVLNTVPVARGPELERALADAALRSKHAAEESRPKETPLPVVAAPALSSKMLERLNQYAELHLKDTPWGAFDLARVWHFRGTPTMVPPESAALTSKVMEPTLHRTPPPSHDPFSDLGQWLSKVVLAQDLNEKLVSAPRGPLRNQAALASSAGVSLPTVSRWTKAMRDMGFLISSWDGLKIIRRREFLERWASAVHGRAYHDYWVRAILGTPDREILVNRITAAEPRAILLGAEACHHLGLGVIQGAPLQMALPAATPQDLEQVGLQPASSSDLGALLVRVPKFTQSLRRGAVCMQQIPTADAIQCAIDAFPDPARGKEQFEAILRVFAGEC